MWWPVTHLQVCYVPVDVHGRGDAVFGNVFVVVWVRFAVDRVDAGKGDSLLAQGYVTVNRPYIMVRRSVSPDDVEVR